MDSSYEPCFYQLIWSVEGRDKEQKLNKKHYILFVKEDLRMYACRFRNFSRVWLCNSMDCIAHHAPLSMRFSRQEYWESFAMPSSRGSPQPENQTCICLCLLHCRWILYPLNHLEAQGLSLFPFIILRNPTKNINQ